MIELAAFCALLVAAYWVAVFPHDEDGIQIPLQRLADRQAHASRIDPLIPKPPSIHHQ